MSWINHKYSFNPKTFYNQIQIFTYDQTIITLLSEHLKPKLSYKYLPFTQYVLMT